jgi:hypothetical protein
MSFMPSVRTWSIYAFVSDIAGFVLDIAGYVLDIAGRVRALRYTAAGRLRSQL